MSNLQIDLSRAVDEFVAAITELAKRVAIDTLENSLGLRGMAKGTPSLLSIAPHRRRNKRSESDLSHLADRFHAFVDKHPGFRIEQINKDLGTTTKDLALPIRTLIADGLLKTKGTRRATTYFIAEGKGSKKN